LSHHDIHSVDKNIEELAQKTPDNLKIDVQAVLPPIYKIGERLNARIQHIVSYGAFAEILDEKQNQGLIHISNITGGFIQDITDWLEIGQELEVEVIESSSDNKLNLSVKHLKLLPRKEMGNSTLASQLQNIIIPPAQNEHDFQEITSSHANEEDKELEKIYKYLENRLGCVSTASKEIIQSLVKEYGVFTFSMIMAETLNEFHPDMSLLFAKEIQKKIGDGL